MDFKRKRATHMHSRKPNENTPLAAATSFHAAILRFLRAHETKEGRARVKKARQR